MKGVLSNHKGGWGTGGSSDSLVRGNGGEVLIEQFLKNREEEHRQPAERPRRRPTETDPQRRHREVDTEGEMLTLLALLLGVLPCSAPGKSHPAPCPSPGPRLGLVCGCLHPFCSSLVS